MSLESKNYQVPWHQDGYIKELSTCFYLDTALLKSFEILLREATKKKSKKNFTTSVNYLQKWLWSFFTFFLVASLRHVLKKPTIWFTNFEGQAVSIINYTRKRSRINQPTQKLQATHVYWFVFDPTRNHRPLYDRSLQFVAVFMKSVISGKLYYIKTNSSFIIIIFKDTNTILK